MSSYISTSIVALLFLSFSISAQNKTAQIPLQNVLKQLENKFNCTFNYSDTDISNHRVNFIQPNSLSQSLQILESETLFNFYTLSENIIAVSLKKNLINICGKIKFKDEIQSLQDYTITTQYQEIKVIGEKQFQLLLKNDYESIKISTVDFGSKTLEATYFDGSKCKTIHFSDIAEVLQPVLLRNYLAKGINQNIDGSTTIDYNEFDILPGLIEPDVLKTIQALPGILSVNETVSNINIRGGTNDQTLILWDGIKMYQTGHFFGLISAFNPYLTNKVTITKNGSSAFYGDGVSGIVAMETDQKLNNTLKTSWGFNLISTDAFIDLPISKKMSLQLSGRKSISNIIETPTYSSYFQKAFQDTEVVGIGREDNPSNVDFTFYDVDARLLFKPSKTDVFRFNFITLGNKVDFTEVGLVENLPVSRNSNLAQENLSAGLFYQKIWNEKLTFEAQTYGSLYKLKAINSNIPNNQALSQENHVIESGLKVNSMYALNSNIKWKGGYQFNETGIENFQEINNPFFKQSDKQVLRTNSIYGEMQYNLPSLKTNIIGGIRANHINKFNVVLVEPRLSLNTRFLNNFSLQLLGELKSQTTTQNIDFQTDFLGVENRRWVLASPESIPILKSKQFSAGVTFKKNGNLISVDSYIKKIDGITSQSQGFQNQFEEAREIGDYTIFGIDVLLNRQYKNLNTWLSYSFTDNSYNFNAFTPRIFPNNIHIKHAVNYGLNYNLNKFKISGGINWHTGKPATLLLSDDITPEGIQYDFPNNSNLKDFFRVDVSAIYNFTFSKKIKALAGISIWNLLNTQNTLNHYYRINNGEIEEINELSLRFTPNFTFRLFVN